VIAASCSQPKTVAAPAPDATPRVVEGRLVEPGTAAPAAASDGIQGVDSKVTRVTVYSDRARLTREATVEVESAPTVFAFRALPGWVDDGSVRVSSSVGRILDVRVERSFLSTPADKRWKRIESEHRMLSDKLAALTDELAVLEAQKRQIEAIKAFSLEKITKDTTIGNVSVQTYASGKRALLDGLLTGKVDVITTSDIPLVANSFTHEDMRILAGINYLDNVNSIVARRDQGIDKPADIAGKRFGIQKSSAVHYFAHLFFSKHGLSEEAVEPVYMKGSKFPAAIAAGEIDAFSMREPYVSQALTKLGDNGVVFTEPGLYPQYELVVASRGLLEREPGVALAMLKALSEAERFARRNPGQAQQLVADFIKGDADALAQAWNSFSLHLRLDQSLLSALEQEARWAIRRQLTDARAVPNYLTFIHFDALEAINRRAVTIIH